MAVVLALLFMTSSPEAFAISRDEVLVRAQTYAYHPWHMTTSNSTASCDTGYQSAYGVGDYMGLAYDWGGYVTLFEYDDGLYDGLGAGSYASDGVLACTVGLDCSGFVSKAWDVGHFGTATISQTSSEIAFSAVLPADAFNIPSYHIILFGGEVDGGWPIFYEAIDYNTHVNATGGWATVDGYTPIRLDGITSVAPGPALGSAPEPIVVTTFPFVHDGDTSDSLSDMFDYYGADTTKKETGPEDVFEVHVTEPGVLTASIQDGDAVDVDVQLCKALDTYDCILRDHLVVETTITECGTWYVIVDSWCNASGVEFDGPYTLTIELEPTGGACTAQNEPFDFAGEPGEACSYPGDYSLPFCNPNLGGTMCLYSDAPGDMFSFCSYGCATDADCTGAFPGGCCGDIAGLGDPADFFCLDASFCTPVVTPEPAPEVVDPPPVDTIAPPEEVTVPVDTTVPPLDTTTPSDTAAPDTVGPGIDATSPDTGTTPAGDAGGLDTPVGSDTTTPTGDTTPAGADTITPSTGDTGGLWIPPSATEDDGAADEPGEEGGCTMGTSGSAPESMLVLLLLVLFLRRVRRLAPHPHSAPPSSEGAVKG